MADDLARGTFDVVNELGLHARAAAKLVQLASGFVCDVVLEKEGRRANAKSVMGVLLLCGQRGSRINVEARGVDAPEAVQAIGQLFEKRFGEER